MNKVFRFSPGYTGKAFGALLCCASTLVLAQPDLEKVMELSLSDLLSMEITSVSKKSQQLNEVATAVHVITAEDIRHSGVTSIAEALRLAPGIQVARIDANKWAISSRGFNEQFANKLLVLMDGRSVYTPSFSGVYWDAQDTLLEDIERIEVIRGPGATIWGANAMNGVINIITKNSSETLGGLIQSASGNNEKANLGFRYGLRHSDSVTGRYFLKYNERDSYWKPAVENIIDNDAHDHWENLRAGFRLDGQANEKSQWTIQGDIYRIDAHQLVNVIVNPFDPVNAPLAPFYRSGETSDQVESSGWNILGKWEYQQSETSLYTLKAYLDSTDRSEISVGQHHKTFDVEFQHQFELNNKHDIIWGLGYRNYKDSFTNSYQLSFLPDAAQRELYNVFVQDEIELLTDSLYLTIGSKFEHNDFTGLEIQPSIRMSWLFNERITFWAAVSRAIRSPARAEDGSRFVFAIVPIPPTFSPLVLANHGSNDFDSENLTAWEAGYRIQLNEALFSDIAVFYNQYDDLRSSETMQSGSVFGNKLEAKSYGVEISLNWQPEEWFLLQSNYSFIKLNGKQDADSTNVSNSVSLLEDAAPKNQLSVRATIALNPDLSLDFRLSYVDKLAATNYTLPSVSVPSYTSFNSTMIWRIQDHWEISLIGQNLFDSHHAEFIAEEYWSQTEIERSIYAQVKWHF